MGQNYTCCTCGKLVTLDYNIEWEYVMDLDCYECDREKKFINNFIWFTPFEMEEYYGL